MSMIRSSLENSCDITKLLWKDQEICGPKKNYIKGAMIES